MPGYGDIQQVCENGHQITNCLNTNPEKNQKFCQECGAPTIIACPSCGGQIQGAQIRVVQSWLDARTGDSKQVPETHPGVPSYCSNCGNPYPWTKKKILSAIQMFAEFGDLSEEEKSTIEEDINNISKDTPRAELSAMRIKRIWNKCGKIAYNVVMDFSSKTAAEILKNS